MLYLLDASLLITAHSSYYPIDAVPEYWDWLLHMANRDAVKIPFEILQEVRDGPDGETDLLYEWLQRPETKEAILLKEEVAPELVQRVVHDGYAADLTDAQLEQIGRDPFLVAYALAATGRCVATVEKSEPRKQRQNRKLPNVCETFAVPWCDPFQMNKALGFRTNWRNG